MNALLEILAELVAVSVHGSRRSRAVSSGLPSQLLQEYLIVPFPLSRSSISSEGCKWAECSQGLSEPLHYMSGCHPSTQGAEGLEGCTLVATRRQPEVSSF